MSYLVTSFYTRATPYEKEVSALQKSIDKLELQAHVEAVPDQGSWEKNCQYKAIFLLDMLDRFQGTNLVWVDADSVFTKRPILFDSLDCDLAYHVLAKNKELLSGTLFLRNCDSIRNLLEDWIFLNAGNNEWDQINLQILLERRPALDCTILPADYCRIFDNQDQESKDPVIIHYQASRRFKDVINGHRRLGGAV